MTLSGQPGTKSCSAWEGWCKVIEQSEPRAKPIEQSSEIPVLAKYTSLVNGFRFAHSAEAILRLRGFTDRRARGRSELQPACRGETCHLISWVSWFCHGFPLMFLVFPWVFMPRIKWFCPNALATPLARGSTMRVSSRRDARFRTYVLTCPESNSCAPNTLATPLARAAEGVGEGQSYYLRGLRG